MSTGSKTILRELFLARYGQLRRQLFFRLGSEDLASDALQETWLRIEDMDDTASVRSHPAYLFQVALNVAEDQRKRRARVLSDIELDALYEMADDMAGPERIAEACGDLEALERALMELPLRQRTIVLAARVEGMPHRQLAAYLGVSPRTVEKELRAALEHCCRRLGRSFVQRFGPGAGRPRGGADD